ncbi:MAG TPA: DNA primase [Vicinamibacterales bacterium]|nr:DNA primase [Vicinamibacterales bacterium]
MGLFPQQFIDDLRLQVNILQVIQEYVPLRKMGATWKGLCPFHSEKTPSFHVNPEKGFFHCFGCGVGGNVFKFLELHEKVTFPEAVRMLAQKAGMSIPETVDAEKEQGHDAKTRETLLKIHEEAAAYFREMLGSAAGARARQQLADREVPQETIEQLGLGFAPNSRDGLKSRLLTLGFPQALLLQSGLILQRDNGDVIDRFRNRLMIPICRDTGSVIAFGGRAMDADQIPKYLNSPETPIYSKSRTLYGLHLSKAAVRKVGFAVLVEGYFDFAQVFRTDAAPVVASCGTALTPQQAQLLRRFTTKIVLSFDPDAAGQGAAIRSCELLVAEGFDVNVVVLDKGEDPDTFIRKKGAGAYRERLRHSRPYLEYLLDQAAAGVDLEHGDKRREFLNKMLAVAARIPDAAARDQFADRIAHKARITEDVVRAEIRKAAVNRKTAVTAREVPSLPAGPGAGPLKPAERGLIWGLFHKTDEARAALAGLDAGDLEHLAGREIFELARELSSEPAELLPSELLRRLSTMNGQLVTGIAGEAAAPVTGPGDLAECARILKRLRCERERAAIQREIDRLQGLGSTSHGDELDLLLNQKRTLAQRIEELTS